MVLWYCLHSSWCLNLAQGSPSAVPSHSWSAYIQKGHFLGGSGCVVISFMLAHSWPIYSNHRARPWNISAVFSRSSSARFRLSAGNGIAIIPPPCSRSHTRQISLLSAIVFNIATFITHAWVAVGSHACIYRTLAELLTRSTLSECRFLFHICWFICPLWRFLGLGGIIPHRHQTNRHIGLILADTDGIRYNLDFGYMDNIGICHTSHTF